MKKKLKKIGQESPYIYKGDKIVSINMGVVIDKINELVEELNKRK